MSGTTPSHAHAVPRFVLVGCANLVVSLGAFYFCYHYLPLGAAASLQGAVANVLSYVAGMLNSFLLNRLWTFRAGHGQLTTQAWRFTVLNAASLIGSTLVVFVFVDRLHWSEVGVWIPAAAVIMMANYVGMKYWAFLAPRAARSA
jgi:putative flippase GtrA